MNTRNRRLDPKRKIGTFISFVLISSRLALLTRAKNSSRVSSDANSADSDSFLKVPVSGSQTQLKEDRSVPSTRNPASYWHWRYASLSCLIVFGLIFCSLSQLNYAQCPEVCSVGNNTAIGVNALTHLTNGASNAALGFDALEFDQTGSSNTGIGFQALLNNTIGNDNTAVGLGALKSNTGSDNTATGFNALVANINSSGNTADGADSLAHNTTGTLNVAVGYQSLEFNTVGSDNTAVGASALLNNTSGRYNTANGAFALLTNQSGSYNTAEGYFSLYHNTGSENTATGYSALQNNTSGHHNTSIGTDALFGTTTGIYNTATGASALQVNQSGSSNTADGTAALFFSTGSNNIGVGSAAGFYIGAGNNNIDIGNTGADADSDTIRIGTAQASTYIAGIVNQPLGANPVPVFIDSTGKLGTAAGSSERFKKEIKSMGDASQAILSLRPVTFQYITDKEGFTQFGLIAEEVAKLNPDLVLRDKENKPYTVRYDAVNAMLLNEFLKEHRKVAAQTAEIAQLKSELSEQRRNIDTRTAQQDKAIAVLASQLEKVSAQFIPANLIIRGTTEQ